jgi:hypothetical protein
MAEIPGEVILSDEILTAKIPVAKSQIMKVLQETNPEKFSSRRNYKVDSDDKISEKLLQWVVRC